MLFNVYVFFLIASGVVMLVLGSLRAPYAKRRRVWNLAFGAGFTIYGLYLLVFFQGGHYILFLYAFVLPVLMAVRFFRDRTAYRAARQAGPVPPAGYAQPPAYGQAPTGYGQPSGYGQPQNFGPPQDFVPSQDHGQQGGYGQQPPFQP
jgi:hypothetical protein